MIKNGKLYNDLAKRLVDYTEEPSKHKREHMLLSIDGKIGVMRKNHKQKEAMALEELRKIMRRVK